MMVYSKGGFILIEALVSLIIVTICIVSCMRCYVQARLLESHALKAMACVDNIEEMLENLADDGDKSVSICKNNTRIITYQVSEPRVSGFPNGFVCKGVDGIRVIAISVSYAWNGQNNEVYCIPVIVAGRHRE
jgi:Tfp pilus assembly protein PilX